MICGSSRARKLSAEGFVERLGAGRVLAHLPHGRLDNAGGGDAGNQFELELRGPAVGPLHLAHHGIEAEQQRDLGIGGERGEEGEWGRARRLAGDEVLIDEFEPSKVRIGQDNLQRS